MTTTTQQKTVSIWQLFITFLKVGAFTFGGGYAMIAILQEELVAKKRWITDADMLNMIVIAESTPGVIAVNTATSVGYRLRGVLGAIVATLGAVLPSFCIIFGLSFAIQAFQNNVWYQAAFNGIQACVIVLVINAFCKMVKQIDKDVFSYVVMFASFAVALFTNFNVIFIILIGAAIGIGYTLIKQAVSAKKQAALPLANTEQSSIEQQSNAEADANNHHDALPSDNYDVTQNATLNATSQDGLETTKAAQESGGTQNSKMGEDDK